MRRQTGQGRVRLKGPEHGISRQAAHEPWGRLVALDEGGHHSELTASLYRALVDTDA
ncbi:hypothetical protein ABZU76_38605 [Amycolatopsis sp. NPDC005232]|uniref:hypothetical protein n=1 Tax=Amycolatopsis sp. NPDC005232 TaxID=3157027 RepID=UPI0033B5408C